MARINLLPWRDELRKQQQQDFVAGVFAVALFMCLILGLVYMHIEGLKQYQQRRNQMIKDEIAVLDRKIREIREIESKKDKLLTKIEVIQKLQESRPEIVHLFEELAKATPEGVHLTKFVQNGQELLLEGKAQSNARVSAFMRTIEGSEWLKQPKLSFIKGQGDKKGTLNSFSMTAKQGQEKPGEQEEGQ